MGNCQAIDAASMVLQHPSGRVERLYWPVTASEVMRMHPGHYVALIITICLPEEEEKCEKNSVRVTRVKLLKPKDTLVLGQAYRLITSQEVMKVLWAKKYGKTKKKESSKSTENPPREEEIKSSEHKNEAAMLQSQAAKQEKNHQKTVPSGSVRSRPWRPSLASISEAGFPQHS